MELVAREKGEQPREARAMAREVKHPLKQFGGTGRICKCGRLAARDFDFNTCSGWLPDGDVWAVERESSSKLCVSRAFTGKVCPS